MEQIGLDNKLQRLEECAAGHPYALIRRSLLHAYVGCLDERELPTATRRTINSNVLVRQAIRTRLTRIGNSGCNQKILDEVADKFLCFDDPPRRQRDREDSLLSIIYTYLSFAQRSKVLSRWRGRGNRSSLDRWLKAVENDKELFSIEEVEKVWRYQKQSRAIKIFVKNADANRIEIILPDIIEEIEEGWLISRAALRSRHIPIDSWRNIRAKFPATFLYLCFKMGYTISEEEAYQIIIDQSREGDYQQTGLAVWAVGQLQMWNVLERIRKNKQFDDLNKFEYQFMQT